MPRTQNLQMHPNLDSEGEEEAAADRALQEVGASSLQTPARDEGEWPASEDTGATPPELQWREHGIAGTPMSPIEPPSIQDQSRRYSFGSQPSLEEVPTPPDDLFPLEPELEAVYPPPPPIEAPPPPAIVAAPAAPPLPLTPPPPLPMPPPLAGETLLGKSQVRPKSAVSRRQEGAGETVTGKSQARPQSALSKRPEIGGEFRGAAAPSSVEKESLPEESASSSASGGSTTPSPNFPAAAVPMSGEPSIEPATGPEEQISVRAEADSMAPSEERDDEAQADGGSGRAPSQGSQGSTLTFKPAAEEEQPGGYGDAPDPLDATTLPLDTSVPALDALAEQTDGEAVDEAEDAPLLVNQQVQPLPAEQDPAQAQSRNPQVHEADLRPGQLACIVGLQESPQYNQCHCIIEGFEADTASYAVRIVDKGTGVGLSEARVHLSRNNLELLGDDTLHGESGGQVAVPVEPDPEESDSSDDEIMKEALSKAAFGRQQSGVRQTFLDWFAVYTRLVVRWPIRFIVFYAVLIILLHYLLWRPIELDEDLSSFVRADGEAMRNRDAFSLALEEQNTEQARRLKRQGAESEHVDSDGPDRRLQSTSSWQGNIEWVQRDLVLVYEAKDSNILDERALRDIQDFELRLRSLPEWKSLCYDAVTTPSDRWGCDPGESLAAFVWPTQQPGNASNHERTLVWDGRGSEALPMPAVLAFMHTASNVDETRDVWRFLPSDFSLGSIYTSSPKYAPRLRSQFSFVLTYSYSSWSAAESKAGLNAMKKRWEDLVTGPVYDLLLEMVDSYPHIRIYYSGDSILTYEITEALMTDILWAIGSLAYVTFYIYIHNRSVLLSLGSFFIIFTSVPLAYVLVPAAKTTFASLMSVFLITVIDIDIIFVFNDFWEQSVTMRTLDMRIAWMLLRAGKSCLATSLTTSVSFFANLASALQPLREFGLFMGMCVMNVYILALLFLPPLVALQEKLKGRAGKSAKKVDPNQEKEAEEPLVGGSESTAPLQPDDIDRKRDRQRCCRKRRKKKPHETRTYMILTALVEAISRCPCFVLLLTMGLVAMFCWGMITGFVLDTSLPEIFPPEHNQVAGKEALDTFDTVDSFAELPSRSTRNSGAFCDPRGRHPGANDSTSIPCVMNWCSADPNLAGPLAIAYRGDMTQNATLPGSCYRSPTRILDPDTSAFIEERGFGVDACMAVQIGTRVVIGNNGVPKLPSTEEITQVWDEVVSRMFNSTVLVPNQLYMTPTDPLVAEEWESGDVAVHRLFVGSISEARWGATRLPDPTLSMCQSDIICYFSAKACEPQGWRRYADVNLTISLVPDTTPQAALQVATTSQPGVLSPGSSLRRLHNHEVESTSTGLSSSWFLQPGARPTQSSSASHRTSWRRLQPVSQSEQIDVDVVYGIRPLKSTPLIGAPPELWSFDPNFEPDNPWAQRGMIAMCEEAIKNDDPYELWVMDHACWIMDFKSWLQRQGKRFPTRNFQTDVRSWFNSAGDDMENNLWFVDNQLKACKMTFWVDVSKNVDADEALDYMEYWDNFITNFNLATSVTANSAFHTAQKWVQAEAQVAIVSSTIDTVLIETGIGWFGILMFTGDPVLALLVLMLILGNICGLAFFMITIMEWSIGPIEVIFIVVFLGFSVTYGLHTSHNYSAARATDASVIFNEKLAWRRRNRKDANNEKACNAAVKMTIRSNRGVRKARTRAAILEVGGAIMSSTVSTVGSSIFLLFCSLNIFISLGFVVIAVTTLSILFTLISLPAVLMLLGPGPDPWYKKYPRKLVKMLCGGGQKGADKESLSSPRQPLAQAEDATSPSNLHHHPPLADGTEDG